MKDKELNNIAYELMQETPKNIKALVDKIEALESENEQLIRENKAFIKGEISEITNSEIGSHHWYSTLLSQINRIGSFLNEKPDNVTKEYMKEWGLTLTKNAQEILSYLNKEE